MRFGPQVEKERHATLDEALTALARRIPDVSSRPVANTLGRAYEPIKQVAGRLELHGPRGTHGGIDVRGDGSTEAYTGWIRKEPVDPADGEDAIEALRRALTTS
jgi:hypothetical protein